MSRNQIHRVISQFLALVLLLALAGVSASQQKMDSFSADYARAILRDAHDAVKRNYYDPNYHGVDIDARYHEYNERIKNAPSIDQAFHMVAAYLEGLKDSHTYFQPPSRHSRIDYGFRMRIFGDNCFITRVRPGTDAESKVHPGDQVIAYDGFDVNRTDFQDLSYYFNGLAPQRTTVLNLHDPQGKERKVTVDSKVRELKKVYDLAQGSDIWDIIRDSENFDHLVRQRHYEIGDVMIWKMPEFVLDDGGVDHLFDIARKYKDLILDLRGNPGGSILTLERMIGNVFDHDIKIADRIARKNPKPQLAKTRGDNSFSGKILVLVDSNSASAAELSARAMQLEHRGTVLGDRSAGAVMETRFYSFSEGMDTKIFYGFAVTDADLIMKDGKSIEHAGVTPDEVILPTGQDLAAGRDPVQARAAQLVGLNLEPAKADKLFPFEWLPD